IHLLIREGGYDEQFTREWTNGPFLVRDDTGALLTGSDLDHRVFVSGTYVAVDQKSGDLVLYDSGRGAYRRDAHLSLMGTREVTLADGTVASCRPVFERLASIAAEFPPDVVARITGAPAEKILDAARLLAAHRPVSHYFHNGLVQHTNATQAS